MCRHRMEYSPAAVGIRRIVPVPTRWPRPRVRPECVDAPAWILPDTCSAKVLFRHASLPQKNRRTHRCSNVSRPAIGVSDSLRSSRLCTRTDLVPHPGQAASGACVLARIRTDRPNNATRSTHTSARCGNRTASNSVIDTGHVRDHEPRYRREHPNRDILARIDHTKWVRATLIWPRTFLNREPQMSRTFRRRVADAGIDDH